MSELTLQHIVRKPIVASDGPAPLLVLLHGVRSNEQDLMGLAPALDNRFFIVSARAPITMGPGAYGWYHVEFRPDGYIIDEAEAAASQKLVRKFVHELVDAYPVDPGRVFVGGFSQGCIMSLGASLSEPRLFAGVAGMSGRLLKSSLSEMAPEEQMDGLAVLVVHGTQDQIIPIEYGREIRQVLGKLPVDLTYREYEMGHQVNAATLRDVAEWLTGRLDSPSDWRKKGA